MLLCSFHVSCTGTWTILPPSRVPQVCCSTCGKPVTTVTPTWSPWRLRWKRWARVRSWLSWRQMRTADWVIKTYKREKNVPPWKKQSLMPVDGHKDVTTHPDSSRSVHREAIDLQAAGSMISQSYTHRCTQSQRTWTKKNVMSFEWEHFFYLNAGSRFKFEPVYINHMYKLMIQGCFLPSQTWIISHLNIDTHTHTQPTCWKPCVKVHD